MKNHIVIGKITLNEKWEFTEYSENAAWTDYVTCEPQVVELKYDGYWVFGSFAGILTRSTFPSSARNIGNPSTACFQTQAWGGIGAVKDRIELAPGWAIEQVSTYGDGRPMWALKKVDSAI